MAPSRLPLLILLLKRQLFLYLFILIIICGQSSQATLKQANCSIENPQISFNNDSIILQYTAYFSKPMSNYNMVFAIFDIVTHTETERISQNLLSDCEGSSKEVFSCEKIANNKVKFSLILKPEKKYKKAKVNITLKIDKKEDCINDTELPEKFDNPGVLVDIRENTCSTNDFRANFRDMNVTFELENETTSTFCLIEITNNMIKFYDDGSLHIIIKYGESHNSTSSLLHSDLEHTTSSETLPSVIIEVVCFVSLLLAFLLGWYALCWFICRKTLMLCMYWYSFINVPIMIQPENCKNDSEMVPLMSQTVDPFNSRDELGAPSQDIIIDIEGKLDDTPQATEDIEDSTDSISSANESQDLLSILKFHDNNDLSKSGATNRIMEEEGNDLSRVTECDKTIDLSQVPIQGPSTEELRLRKIECKVKIPPHAKIKELVIKYSDNLATCDPHLKTIILKGTDENIKVSEDVLSPTDVLVRPGTE
ncbi:unnamed protein product, partial [Lymnaea stagnalis]